MEKIIEFLELKKIANAKYCDINDCQPSPYMEGSNRIIDETISYIKSLK
jgi:hypothetical protein